MLWRPPVREAIDRRPAPRPSRRTGTPTRLESLVESVSVHLGEHVGGEWNRRIGREHCIDTAPWTKGGDAIRSVAGLGLLAINPVSDFARTEDLLTVEAGCTLAALHELAMVGGIPVDTTEVSAIQHGSMSRYNALAQLQPSQ